MGDGYHNVFAMTGPAFEPTSDGPTFAPLKVEEVDPYLRRRLLDAGWRGRPALDPELGPALHEATGGEPGAIDRAMTALLTEAASSGAEVVDGLRLTERITGVGPQRGEGDIDLAHTHRETLEEALARQEQELSDLRLELTELRVQAKLAPARIDERLDALEARLDRQDEALRHVLERLIGFFDRERAG